MENIVSRRDFLKGISVVALTGLIGTAGCSKEEKENDNSSLSFNDMNSYNLVVTSDNEAMLLKYEYIDSDNSNKKQFNCFYLDTESKNEIKEVLLYYDYDINSLSEEVLTNYVHMIYNIELDVPASLYFIDYYGMKDSYSYDEVTELLSNAPSLVEENKVLIKS